MATADDRFSQTGHSTASSSQPGLSRHPVATENVRTNGGARTGPSNGYARQGGEPAQQCPGPQQGKKAGAVNGKAARRPEQLAPDYQDNRTRRTRVHNRNVPGHNRSAWANLRRKIEAIVDVLNLGWGTYLAGLVLVHFLI